MNEPSEGNVKKPNLSVLANLALVIAAAFTVWNTASSRSAAEVGRPELMLHNWEQELGTGIAVGPEDAPIKIVELMDFRCSFCRAWSARLDSLLTEHPGSVRVAFHHWPLRNHPHALSAAVAAECADGQGAFSAFARAVFADQQLIGDRSWREFAEMAGVPDLDAFEACAALPAGNFQRIQLGIDLARSTRATGTPTVWVNGQLSRPTLEALRRMAEEASRSPESDALVSPR
jgi:protein-disulfide isomerase